jgi:hypothetical protein
MGDILQGGFKNQKTLGAPLLRKKWKTRNHIPTAFTEMMEHPKPE